MASILRSKAIKNVSKGNTSAYYSYVEEKNGTNPVIQQLEKDLTDFEGFVKKKNSGLVKPNEQAPCKVSDALFDIWNRYESRISPRLFNKKLMEIGEFLVNNREYSTACWQCYDRYLSSLSNGFNLENIQNLEDLRKAYFEGGIQNNENSDVIFRALMGHCICVFYFSIEQDPKLLNTNSVYNITEIMRILRLIIQLLLEVEHFCWLVYNGTIYMYTIGRYMMQYGQSRTVLEYFLFICLSMETSIPLLGVKYLSWRATLYAATCQCFYDCKFSEDGETFARRALSKINELYEIEQESINGEKGTIDSLKFRDATIRIGCVLFKRLVFESRRKSKGVIRPKVRLNYKDLANQTWPRTGVERLLSEMFDCPSAQFLAIEEALAETNRRIAMPSAAATDSDFEILDVVLELLFAGEYLAAGGSQDLELKALVSSEDQEKKTQIEMAISGASEVRISGFLRLVKYSFNYEAWEVFRRLSTKIISFIQKSPSLSEKYKSDIQIINLLQVLDKYLIHLRKLKHLKNEVVKANIAAAREANKNTIKAGKAAETAQADTATETKAGEETTKLKSTSKKSVKSTEEKEGNKELAEEVVETVPSPSIQESLKEEDLLVNIAVKLVSIIDSGSQKEKIDLDVIVDVTLVLWKKCKELFQKYQTGAQDNYRWINKLENLPKWLFILNVTHESMCCFNISTIDPAMFAHCSLRLALLYESIASMNIKKSSIYKDSISQAESNEDQVSLARTNLTKLNIDLMNINVEKYGVLNDIKGNLVKARNILRKSLDSIALARAIISRTDKSFLCDKEYDENNLSKRKDISTKSALSSYKLEKFKSLKERQFKYDKNVQTDSVSNFIADLHVELIYLYHKIGLRLLDFLPPDKKPIPKGHLKNVDKEFAKMVEECKRNKISESLLLLNKALYLHNSKSNQSDQKGLVESAYQKLVRAEVEDRMIYDKHVKIDALTVVNAKIPPAPIVCLRTANKIVVQPRNFHSASNEVCWYRVFASKQTAVSSKARISDYTYAGTGNQVPALNCEKVSITGLEPDEKYIFAVAAYDKNGNLIGDSIGDSTDPILASSTLSILMGWTYMCQVSYQIGEYDLALSSFQVLWDNFILRPLETQKESRIEKNQIDYEFSFHQLNYDIVEKTSPLLLRKFLECFFVVNDIQVKRKKLYCDLLFEGKIPYANQIERVKECEKLLVAIDVAAWLNDTQLIMQAIIQCYGLLAPLIYFNLAYEPICQILSHCLLILDELPSSAFQRKPRGVFDSLQHMIACTTYYLTDVLKRFNRRSLCHYLNMIGRKLLGMDESLRDDDTDFDDNIVENQTNKNKVNKTQKGGGKVGEEKSKGTELKALEIFAAKSNINKNAAFFNMLSGNEDTAQIYAYIVGNATKQSYRELVKFRRRAAYFEYIVQLLQKALTEELNAQEVNEWCEETLEWMQKRNASILGTQVAVIKKPEVITVSGNVQKQATQEFIAEAERMNQPATQTTSIKQKTKKKGGVKKYRLLIPLDLELHEKFKLEEKQKKAIDVLYDLLPDRYEASTRRKKLRKLFHEEAAFKSQFYSIWALNSFGALRNRIMSVSRQQKIYASEYLDPLTFLLDNSMALLKAGALRQEGAAEQQTSKLTDGKSTKVTSSIKDSVIVSSVSDDKSSSTDGDVKDVCEIMALVISGVGGIKDENTSEKPIGAEFIDSIASIFDKFKLSTVFAHRSKQWTQLLNTCKLMLNVLNSIIYFLPTVLASNLKNSLKINDFWKSISQPMYLACEHLLDILIFNSPSEKSNPKDVNDFQINKWYDSIDIGKASGGFKFDTPLDNITALDLRFIKSFIQRGIQCLAYSQKWEKLCSVGLKFNMLTSNRYAESISPVIAFAQNKLLKQAGSNTKQAHLERLKAELGRYPRMEDLLFMNFKIEISSDKVTKTELGVKIDPRVHNIYTNDNKSRELISIPLDPDETLRELRESIEMSFYSSRALLHARRLLSLFLLAQNAQQFFVLSNTNPASSRTSKDDFRSNDEFFHANPIKYEKKRFENEDEVFIGNDLRVTSETIIESYSKSIQLMISNKDFDLASQAMHELGNFYHFSKKLELAYKQWNDSLDNLTGIKDTITNWRGHFYNAKTQETDLDRILEKCGVWGCLLGGVLSSKIAQYYLTNNVDLRTESCLLSATFFKSILRGSVPYSKYDVDYVRDELNLIPNDNLLPGILFNNDMYRFDVKYIISALNFICLALVNTGHCMKIMPSLALYEYFARVVSRDLSHTVFARLIKLEALIKLNLFNEAIDLLVSLQRAERLPHFIDEKTKNYVNFKLTDLKWNSSKPIFDSNNLKLLESILCLKLPNNVVKLYGPHLTCRFVLAQCKLFIQLSRCLPCLPNMDEFNSTQLSKFHESDASNSNESFNASKSIMLSARKANTEDNPDALKVFTKNPRPLTLDFIKACLLGTSKTIITKCLRSLAQDFSSPEKKQKQSVSANWQREFKYECDMCLGSISDQMHFNYLGMQNIVEAMNELNTSSEEVSAEAVSNEPMATQKVTSPQKKTVQAQKTVVKKGLFQVFDVICGSHLNARLWIKSRLDLAQLMLNQLVDAGKAKGHDENIISDFGDLSYYCQIGIEECANFSDSESKAQFRVINASLRLLRGESLKTITSELDVAINEFNAVRHQLSTQALLVFFRSLILREELKFTLNLLENHRPNAIEESIGEFLSIQHAILDHLRLDSGEEVERFVEKDKSCYDNVNGIKNLFNPLLLLIVHLKLRLGSLLMLKAVSFEGVLNIDDEMECWKYALNTLTNALEMNKVISERSVALEIELNQKRSRCLMSLFTRFQLGSLNEIIDAYSHTLTLAHASTHDLSTMRSCYQDIAFAFISTISTIEAAAAAAAADSAAKASSTTAGKKKINTQQVKATEAAICALGLAQKVSNAMRNRMLLPGHKAIKNAQQSIARQCPIFVQSDLLAYAVLAERKRVYRDEIEEEILSLAPEFEVKQSFKSNDDKIKLVSDEASKSLTWIHVLNYQTKLNQTASMRNLNTLKNGSNRYKFSEFYTIGHTPVLKSVHLTSSRLYELNMYLKSSLPVYKSETQAPPLVTEYFRLAARRCNLATRQSSIVKKPSASLTSSSYIRVFLNNQASSLSVSMNANPEKERESVTSLSVVSLSRVVDFSYLQQWPANFDYTMNGVMSAQKINDSTTVDAFIEFTLSFNWYKSLIKVNTDEDFIVTAVVATKDSLVTNKIRNKGLPAKSVIEIHDKLAPLASIADTSLDQKGGKVNENDVNTEFLSSLKSSISLIGKLFGKTFDSQMKIPFDLKASNIVDLEMMFNINFGGSTNNESLKNFILNLFN